MKPNIHPELVEAEIRCICGTIFKTMSSNSKMSVEICSNCHPYYTGQQSKIIDTAGRVERFNQRYSQKK